MLLFDRNLDLLVLKIFYLYLKLKNKPLQLALAASVPRALYNDIVPAVEQLHSKITVDFMDRAVDC